ncbi:chromophore lyase CRL, chloroplastic, partial [Fagus crenata]
DIAEHLTTLYLKHCERGNRCLYEGSTPPGVFRNSWNGAMYCNSELAMEKYNEIHTCDRGYDDNRNQ